VGRRVAVAAASWGSPYVEGVDTVGAHPSPRAFDLAGEETERALVEIDLAYELVTRSAAVRYPR